MEFFHDFVSSSNILSILLIMMLTTPWAICFFSSNRGPYHVFKHFLEAFFFLDIFMNFRFAIEDEHLNIISDKQVIYFLTFKIIALSYLKGWFIFDLISAIPLT